MKKVLLIPDIKNWALDHVAQEIKKVAEKQNDIDISIFYASEIEKKKTEFYKEIENSDIIHWLCQFGYRSINTDKMVFRKIHKLITDENVLKESIKNNYTITTFCDLDYQYFKNIGLQTIDCRHGVNTNHFFPMSKTGCRGRKGISQNKFIIGAVGKMMVAGGKYKRPEMFIEICKQLPIDKIHIAVFGPENEEFKKMLDNARIENTLSYANTIDEMRIAYNTLDALLITSWNESGPMPSLEAMACGVPVFSTDVGHMKEITYQQETGYCDNDIKSISDSLNYFISNYSANTCNKKCLEVAKKWSWDRGLFSLMEAYHGA